jgi:hypothetical protein
MIIPLKRKLAFILNNIGTGIDNILFVVESEGHVVILR